MKLKKTALSFIGVLAVGTVIAYAAVVNWHTANSAPIAWDAVTTLSDGTLLPAGSTIEYEISICDAIADPDNPGEWVPDLNTAVVKWTGTDLNCLVTADREGRYFFGGQSFRIVDGERVSESEQVWANDPTVCADGQSIGFQYFLPPANPGGFK